MRPVDGGGANFGWPILEGTAPFRGGATTGLTPPVAEYLHGTGALQGSSVTGGVRVPRARSSRCAACISLPTSCVPNIWSVPVSQLVPGHDAAVEPVHRAQWRLRPGRGRADQHRQFRRRRCRGSVSRRFRRRDLHHRSGAPGRADGDVGRNAAAAFATGPSAREPVPPLRPATIRRPTPAIAAPFPPAAKPGEAATTAAKWSPAQSRDRRLANAPASRPRIQRELGRESGRASYSSYMCACDARIHRPNSSPGTYLPTHAQALLAVAVVPRAGCLPAAGTGDPRHGHRRGEQPAGGRRDQHRAGQVRAQARDAAQGQDQRARGGEGPRGQARRSTGRRWS